MYGGEPLFEHLVAEELAQARNSYSAQESLHEGYAVLLEEVEELWAEIKKRPKKRKRKKLLREAVQVAAMIQRLAEDNDLLNEEDD